MREFMMILENAHVWTPERCRHAASQYCNGMGATNVGDVDLFDWRFEPEYPLARIEDIEEMGEWMKGQVRMWAAEGEPNRYDDEMQNPIREPIIVYDSKVKGGQILDGMHRVGGSVIQGRTTIPAIVGTAKKRTRSIAEGIEEMGGTQVAINPSRSQLVGLCTRLSQHQILRGYFFTTKTDPSVQLVVWGAEKNVHFHMGKHLVQAGFDCDESTALIIGLEIDPLLKTCDWDSWDVYQSGDLLYVRDRFGQSPAFDAAFDRLFPASQELAVEYNDDAEWEIVDA